MGDDYLIHLNPSAAYTPIYVEYGGSIILDATRCGSCQGTVLRATDEDWLGSCHGGEIVESVTLSVDGSAQEAVAGKTYKGSSFHLEKVSLLGDVAKLESASFFTKRAIVENTTITTLRSDLSLGVVYPFLSRHQNEFAEVVGVRLPDHTMILDSTSHDDGSQFSLGLSYLIGQYDPLAERGVATMFLESMARAGTPFIWDRLCDNKLYFRFRRYSNPIPKGTQWRFRTVRFPFEASHSNWITTVLVLPSDFDDDGDCDLADCAHFQNLVGLTSPETAVSDLTADYDNDNTITAHDFVPLVHRLAGPRQ